MNYTYESYEGRVTTIDASDDLTFEYVLLALDFLNAVGMLTPGGPLAPEGEISTDGKEGKLEHGVRDRSAPMFTLNDDMMRRIPH